MLHCWKVRKKSTNQYRCFDECRKCFMFSVSNMKVNNRDDGLQPDNTYNINANVKEKIVHAHKLNLKSKMGGMKLTPHCRNREEKREIRIM